MFGPSKKPPPPAGRNKTVLTRMAKSLRASFDAADSAHSLSVPNTLLKPAASHSQLLGNSHTSDKSDSDTSSSIPVGSLRSPSVKAQHDGNRLTVLVRRTLQRKRSASTPFVVEDLSHLTAAAADKVQSSMLRLVSSAMISILHMTLLFQSFRMALA